MKRNKPIVIISTQQICSSVDFTGYSNADVFAAVVFDFASLSKEKQTEHLNDYRAYLSQISEAKNIKKPVQTDTMTRKKLSSISLNRINRKTKVGTILYCFNLLSAEEKTKTMVTYLEKYKLTNT